MINNILLPVDLKPSRFHLEDYARFFSHLQGKKFSTFFLTDVTHPKGTKAPVQLDINKSDLQEQIAVDAEKLKVDVDFLAGPANVQLLSYQSRFADLIMVSPVNKESLDYLIHSSAKEVLRSVGCPLLLTPTPDVHYEEVIFLFDYDVSGLEALKSFISLFGGVSSSKKLTVITVSPDDESGVVFEKCLIDLLQQTFSDVGILPMARMQLKDNLVRFASREKRPLLIMGKTALELLGDDLLSGELIDHEMSLFYSNQ